jgi:lysozyme family protein
MRVDEAEAIYREHYWDALRCNDLPAGVDYAVFDYGVNSGVGRAGKVLRRLLGLSDATSRVSDEVIAAARSSDAGRLVAAMCDERLRFLKSLRTWSVFGNGWGRRVAEVRAAALAMASAPPIAPSPPPPPQRRDPPSPDQPAARGLFYALISALLVAFRRP